MSEGGNYKLPDFGNLRIGHADIDVKSKHSQISFVPSQGGFKPLIKPIFEFDIRKSEMTVLDLIDQILEKAPDRLKNHPEAYFAVPTRDYDRLKESWENPNVNISMKWLGLADPTLFVYGYPVHIDDSLNDSGRIIFTAPGNICMHETESEQGSYYEPKDQTRMTLGPAKQQNIGPHHEVANLLTQELFQRIITDALNSLNDLGVIVLTQLLNRSPNREEIEMLRIVPGNHLSCYGGYDLKFGAVHLGVIIHTGDGFEFEPAYHFRSPDKDSATDSGGGHKHL